MWHVYCLCDVMPIELIHRRCWQHLTIKGEVAMQVRHEIAKSVPVDVGGKVYVCMCVCKYVRVRV